MRLEDTLKEQIESLINGMIEQSELDVPSAAAHQERCLWLKEHAWFLKEICLPKIPTQKIAMATLDGTNGVVPERPDSLTRSNGFLRGKGPNTEALMGITHQEAEEPVAQQGQEGPEKPVRGPKR